MAGPHAAVADQDSHVRPPRAAGPRAGGASSLRADMNAADSVRAILFVLFLAVLAWFVRRAAGRLAPRAAFAPILFLVTRKAVLITWVIGSPAFFLGLWTSALANGKDPSDSLVVLATVSAVCGLGIAALVIGPIWAAVRFFTKPPTFELEAGEEIVKELAANHFLRGEARGGRMLLTNRRIGFRPHRFNVQLDTWSALLEDIVSVEPEGERFLVVQLEHGEPQWFVVWKPRIVAADLEALVR